MTAIGHMTVQQTAIAKGNKETEHSRNTVNS